MLDYARHLVSLNEEDLAIKAIDTCLTQHKDEEWQEELLVMFGNINVDEPSRQLTVAEKWLKYKSNNPALLLMLGRLSLKARLWGKARSYLESSLAAQPSADTYQELGHLLEQMGEQDQAREYYRLGLGMGLEANPVKLPDNIKLNNAGEKENLPIPTDATPPSDTASPTKLGVAR